MQFISTFTIAIVVAIIDYGLTNINYNIYYYDNGIWGDVTYSHELPMNDIKKMIWSTVKTMETSTQSKYAYVNYMWYRDRSGRYESYTETTMNSCKYNYRSGLLVGWPIEENEKDLSKQMHVMNIEENFDHSWALVRVKKKANEFYYMFTTCGYLINGRKVTHDCVVANGYSIVNVKETEMKNFTEIIVNYKDHNLQAVLSATHQLYKNKVATVRTKHFYINSVQLLEKLKKEQKAHSSDENAPLNQYLAYRVSNMELEIKRTFENERDKTETFMFCEHDDPWIKLYLQPSERGWNAEIPHRTGYYGLRRNINIDECLGQVDPLVHIMYSSGYWIEGFFSSAVSLTTSLSTNIKVECKNGECVDTVGSYKCKCFAGWTGQFCDKTVDLCEQQMPCGSFKCTNLPGFYKCECGPGLSGSDCSVDVEECEFSKPCKNEAECIETFGSYKCICKAGWTGQNCNTDIDECSKEPKICRNDATCENTQGSFKCKCKPKFTGKLCEFDTNVCRDTKCVNGECIVSNHKPQCQCYPGWKDAVCSTQIDECNEDHDLCKNGGTCTEHPKLNYTCTCLSGFTGRHCEQNINDCTKKNCANGWCVDLVNDVHCICNSSWTGKNCNEKVDSCHDFICEHGSCHVNGGVTGCKCKEGYTGTHCDIEIDECLKDPCSANSTCIDGDTDGEFECLCPPLYTGLTCSNRIPSCSSSTCKNKGTCLLDDNSNYGYTCKCPEGTVGFNCEDIIGANSSHNLWKGSVCQNVHLMTMAVLIVVAGNLNHYFSIL